MVRLKIALQRENERRQVGHEALNEGRDRSPQLEKLLSTNTCGTETSKRTQEVSSSKDPQNLLRELE
jgi:hypothetical protein